MTQANNLTTSIATSDFTWLGYFQAILVVGVLLIGMWFLLSFLKKTNRFKLLGNKNPKQELYLENQLVLGPRKAICVVRFLNKRLLIGLSDNNINLLTELDVEESSQIDVKADVKTEVEHEKNIDFASYVENIQSEEQNLASERENEKI